MKSPGFKETREVVLIGLSQWNSSPTWIFCFDVIGCIGDLMVMVMVEGQKMKIQKSVDLDSRTRPVSNFQDDFSG